MLPDIGRAAPDLSSKPRGRRCCRRSTGQIDGRTLNRLMSDAYRYLMRSYYADSVNQSINIRLLRHDKMQANNSKLNSDKSDDRGQRLHM